MSHSPIPERVVEHAARLRADGIRTLTGVISDSGGVLRAKSVPAARLETFATAGMGASLTWPVFCVDNAVAMTDRIGVSGDLRLTADLSRAVVLDDGFGWAPADLREQSGESSPYCWRAVAARQAQRCADHGLDVLIGAELEFVLISDDGSAVGSSDGWACYGVEVFSRVSGLVADVCETLEAAGVGVEQVHSEYGVGQFEVSLSPAGPVAIADDILLARTIIGRVSRRRGLRASFSPVPFAGGSGSGGHLHMSLTRDHLPLFSGGGDDRSDGLTELGGRAIAGVVTYLSEAIAVLAGTVVSGERLQPGHWAGAFACWGVENREAAVRLIQATPGNPRGANVEVKCIDAGANPYMAVGMILGLALHGIDEQLALPPGVERDPSALSPSEANEHAVVRLPIQPLERIGLFEHSDRVRDILGDELHAAVLAVRKHESSLADSTDLHASTRFAWSG